MKLTNKSLIKQAAARALTISSHPGYSSAVHKLEQLKENLALHEADNERTSRQAHGYFPYLPKGWGGRGRREVGDPDILDAAAQKAIRDGSVILLFSEIEKSEDLDDDRRQFKETLDAQNRAICILKRALEIQQKGVAAQKRLAMEQILESIKQTRGPSLQRIVEAITALRGAIEEERRVVESLVSQDADFSSVIYPPGLNFDALNRELTSWLREAEESGYLGSLESKLATA
jgi:hypothetical protein